MTRMLSWRGGWMAWPRGLTPCRRVGSGRASVVLGPAGHPPPSTRCMQRHGTSILQATQPHGWEAPRVHAVPHLPAPPHPLPQALLEGATADLSHLAGEVEEGFAGLELGMTVAEHRIKGEPSGLAAQQMENGMWLLFSKNG